MFYAFWMNFGRSKHARAADGESKATADAATDSNIGAK
jgi:hypothetical protein